MFNSAMKMAKGLKIQDLSPGEGPEVTHGDIAEIHCVCRLPKGEVLYESPKGAPFQIRVGARDCVVALDQGLIGMRPGGRRQIKAPPHLTHVERKTHLNFPENAVLIYDVELLRILTQRPVETQRW